MEKEKGTLVVEATIILSVLIFFITLVLSFGRVYMAQYYVAHTLLQTGQELGFKAYKYQVTDGSVVALLDDVITEPGDISIKNQWDRGNVAEAVKKTYRYVITNGEDQLKSYGLEEGLASMDFEGTKKEEKTLLIKVKYDVRLPFGFFGHQYATLHQEIRTGLWSK